jgi:serine/threonine protein kinase
MKLDLEKTKQMLKQARSATEDKPYRFAFVAKGSTGGALLVDKQRVAPVLVTAAKKQMEGGTIYRGLCFGEQARLVFLVPKEPPSTLKNQIVKTLRTEFRLALNIEVRVSGKAEEESEGGKVETETKVEERNTTKNGDDKNEEQKEKSKEPDQSEVVARLKDLAPRLRLVLRQDLRNLANNDDAIQARKLFADLNGSIKNKKFSEASDCLEKLEKVIEECWARFTESVTSNDAVDELDELLEKPVVSKESNETRLKKQNETFAQEHAEQRGRIKLMLKKLVADKIPLDGKLKESVDGALKQAALAEKSDKVPERTEALERLQSVAELLQAALDNGTWKKSINLGTYKKSKLLGAGSFGVVYRLNAHGKSNTNAPSLVIKKPRYKENLDEMKHEAEVYEKLGEHPNIARCLGFQKVGGNTGLVMEELKGGNVNDLREKMETQVEQGTIKHTDFWGVMQYSLVSMVKGLQHMHDKGLVHLDLKPDNVMFDTESGMVKLVDMGTVRNKDEAVGFFTPAFASDELVKEGPRDANGVLIDVDKQQGAKARPTQDVFTVGSTAFNLSDQEGTELIRPELIIKNRHDNWLKTQYGNFLTALMDPDPKTRMTLEQALEHPFLKDRLLDDESARNLIKGVKEEPAPEEVKPLQEAQAQPKLLVAQVKQQAKQLDQATNKLSELVEKLLQEADKEKDTKPEALQPLQKAKDQLDEIIQAKQGFQEVDQFEIAKKELAEILTALKDVGSVDSEAAKPLEEALSEKDLLQSYRSWLDGFTRTTSAFYKDIARLGSSLEKFAKASPEDYEPYYSIFAKGESNLTGLKERLPQLAKEVEDQLNDLENSLKDQGEDYIQLASSQRATVEKAMTKLAEDITMDLDSCVEKLQKAREQVVIVVNSPAMSVLGRLPTMRDETAKLASLLDGFESGKNDVDDLESFGASFSAAARNLGKFHDEISEAIQEQKKVVQKLTEDKTQKHILDTLTKAAENLPSLLNRLKKADEQIVVSQIEGGKLFTNEDANRRDMKRKKVLENLKSELSSLQKKGAEETALLLQRLSGLVKDGEQESGRLKFVRASWLKNEPSGLFVSKSKKKHEEVLDRIDQEVNAHSKYCERLVKTRKFVDDKMKSNME